ncbi:MAG: HAMP domain-containing histidine kinase [Balneolaceae bacterium]|nr:HAMP domain-containing histidine kinase [Balneolaceae bacterium]
MEVVKKYRLTTDTAKTREEKLEELFKAKTQELDQFAQIVAHDLKTPLSGIVAMAELFRLEYTEQLDDQANEWITMILDRTHNLAEMINSIYDYSKAGNEGNTIVTFSLEDLIADLVNSLSFPNALTLETPKHFPVITGRYEQLKQVLYYLLDNAIKFHDKTSGIIDLSIREEGDFLTISVSDNGPGITPQYHDLIFGVFKVANEEQPKDGSGVGLTIAKKIVDFNGGQIGLKSEYGEGSEFWFTWPILATELA